MKEKTWYFCVLSGFLVERRYACFFDMNLRNIHAVEIHDNDHPEKKGLHSDNPTEVSVNMENNQLLLLSTYA